MAYTNSSLISYTKLSPNHSGQRTHSIDRITPHCVVGQLSAESICGCFTSASRQASCNYGIGTDGRVSLCVEEKNRSWCSSSRANDQRAVTIECASDTKEPYTMNDAVYSTLVKLCTDICRRNGKTKLLWLGDKTKTLNYIPASNEMVLTVHRWFANKSCPGDWLYARLGDLAAKVTAALGGSTTQSGDTGSGSDAYPAVPFTANVLISNLNYRAKPSMSGAVKGQTGKGTFTIVEVSNGWGKLKSGAGWIWLGNSGYCTIGKTVSDGGTSAPASSSYKVRVTASALNIRKGPSTNYTTNGQIRDKGVYTIVAESGGAGSDKGWGKLKSGAGWIWLGNSGYCTIGKTVSDGGTSAPASSSYKVRVTASALNIRKGPSTNYTTNGQIRDKGVYTIVAESGGAGSDKGWGKLKSGAGWISLDYTAKL